MNKRLTLMMIALLLALSGCETYRGLQQDLHQAEAWADRQSSKLDATLQERRGPTHHR